MNYRNSMTTILIVLMAVTGSFAVRIKDVATVNGLTDIQLTGFGLVVGLRNTGDGPRTHFTTKGIINMLRNVGIEVPKDRVRVRNVAAVMITSNYSPFVKKGSRIDVTVSSIGDARSLEGGTLLLSPLSGADGKMYATAQGPISIGGFDLESGTGATSIRRNHSLVGEIPNGAIIQREVFNQPLPDKELRFTLSTPDFSSAVKMAEAINVRFGEQVAYSEDAATVAMIVPEKYSKSMMNFISDVENVEFLPSKISRVVINEKTGTIVAGGDINISSVAVSHGNITIAINSSSQNANLSSSGGRAAAISSVQEKASVNEDRKEMKVLPNVTNVQQLAKSLNSLGVAPRDIISIFQSIKKAGALHADLVTM